LQRSQRLRLCGGDYSFLSRVSGDVNRTPLQRNGDYSLLSIKIKGAAAPANIIPFSEGFVMVIVADKGTIPKK